MKAFTSSLIYSMILAISLLSLQTPAMAGMIDNEQLALESRLELKRDALRSQLARDDIRSALQSYGVPEDALEQRINNMTETEIQEVQGQLAMLPAGEGALGIVLTVLVVVLFLEILGITDITHRI